MTTNVERLRVSAAHVVHAGGHPLRHSYRYDRIYCVTCDEWVEPQCTCVTSECPFERAPGRPSESGELRSVEAAA